MGKTIRSMYYHMLKIDLRQYEEHKKRKYDSLMYETDTSRMLGWEQASVAILENILKYVEALIDSDEEVNEMIKNGEESEYYAGHRN